MPNEGGSYLDARRFRNMVKQRKPYADEDIIDVDEFLKSIEHDGEFTIFSCCCGIPECSGWVRGIEVVHLEESIKWTNLNTGKSWCFSKQTLDTDLIQIREELKNFKHFFRERNIDYVGVGYNW